MVALTAETDSKGPYQNLMIRGATTLIPQKYSGQQIDAGFKLL